MAAEQNRENTPLEGVNPSGVPEVIPKSAESAAPGVAPAVTPKPTEGVSPSGAPEETLRPEAEREGGEEAGTLAEWLNAPVETPMDGLVWAGLGLAVGVLLTVITALIVSWLRGKRKKAGEIVELAPEAGGITVEKLHEQGARKSQQDSFFVSREDMADAQGLLAVVADGMGGLANGDRTSQAAVTAMANGFYTMGSGAPDRVLLALLAQANQAVNLFLGPEGLRRSGTTVVAGLIRDNAFHYVSVGDSRICLYRDGTLYQLNREHVLRGELNVRAVNGEITFQEVDDHPKAAGLTSFLGMGQLKYVDQPAQAVAIRPGDKFILMSDGVYNALSERELTGALDRGDGSSAAALGELIRAKNYSNQDNYTAVILNC